jgi:phospholipase/carboxylesterase
MRRAGPVAGAKVGVVLGHGRGGSSGDIIGIMAHAGLHDVAAIAPDAPGQSWWPASFLAPCSLLEPHVKDAVAAMTQAITLLEEEGIPRGSIWLAGFSQGACLALETFARAGEGLAGVLSFSGGLVGTDDIDPLGQGAAHSFGPKRFDYSGRRDGARVWLSVYENDLLIPLPRVEESAEVLRQMGADVSLQTYPGAGHAVTNEDIARLRMFLNG